MNRRFESLRREAAKPILQGIRADRDGALPRLRAPLDTIARRLMDTDFNVAALWRECGILNHNASKWFRELDPPTPSAYIATRRFEIAARLLCLDPTVQVWKVARAVGYHSESAFTDGFKSQFGLTPGEYRRQEGGRVAEEEADSAPESCRGLAVSIPPPGVPTIFSGADFERVQVEKYVWPRLAELKFFEDQRRFVSHCGGFSTPALYEFLHQKARDEGRRDRRRGVELAQLALESLRASAETLGSWYHELLPRALAWFANAKRLNLDFLEAETAFDEALKVLSRCDQGNEVITAEISDLRGSLRLFQRRHKEALGLFGQSLEIYERVGDHQSQIKELIHRATALYYDGQPEVAASDLERAGTLVGADTSADLIYSLYWDLAVVYAKADRLEKAQAAITTCEGYLGLCGNPLSPHLLHWAKGFIYDCLERHPSAKASYLVALEGFEALDQPFYSAFVQLDLAIVSFHLDQVDDAARYSSGIVPFFSALKLDDETLAAFLAFKDATGQCAVTDKMLLDFRAALWRDPLCNALSGSGRPISP